MVLLNSLWFTTISKAGALFLPMPSLPAISAASGAKESWAAACDELITSTYRLMMGLVVLMDFVLLKSVNTY